MLIPNSHHPVTQILARQRRLARACAAGDPAAWAELVHAHRRRLLTLAYWLGGSREVAERAVTETFAAAAGAWERTAPSLPLAVCLARTCYELTERAPSATPWSQASGRARS